MAARGTTQRMGDSASVCPQRPDQFARIEADSSGYVEKFQKIETPLSQFVFSDV